MVNIYEIHCYVYIKKNLKHSDSFLAVRKYIDSIFNNNKKYSEFHESNHIKKYVFNSLYPRNIEGYKEDQILKFPIRTSDLNLANLFNTKLASLETEYMKGLKTSIKRINTDRIIDKIQTVTPAIVTTYEKQYWKQNYGLDFFERKLMLNSMKKFTNSTDIDVTEMNKFYNFLEFKYSKPSTVVIKTVNNRDILYKADYITLNVNTDKESQEIAWTLIAEGLLEKNSRGFGYLTFSCY